MWLVLHGGPGGAVSSSLLQPWAGQAQTPVVVPLQLGCYPAPAKASQRVNVMTQLARLEELRRALGIGRWCVLAGSWGAYLALAYASHHPQAIEGMVLRGSFLGGRADIWGLIRRVHALWPHPGLFQPNRVNMATWLSRASQLFQTGTHGALSERFVHVWMWVESLMAAHGVRRSLLHASGLSLAAHPQGAAIRAQWAELSRSQRQRQAWLQTGRKAAPQNGRKLGLQLKLLPRVMGRKPWGSLPGTRVPLTLLHGRFDAVCSPRNVQQVLQAWPGSSVQWVHAGHLGSEPALRRAMACAVGAA